MSGVRCDVSGDRCDVSHLSRDVFGVCAIECGVLSQDMGTIVLGKVESGTVSKGQILTIMPNRVSNTYTMYMTSETCHINNHGRYSLWHQKLYPLLETCNGLSIKKKCSVLDNQKCANELFLVISFV